MSAVDYALVVFGAIQIAGSAVSITSIVLLERELRVMRESVKWAGEARWVGAGKDGGG